MALAMTTVPASHGGVVLGILPLATAVFAVILARERPSPLFWICGVIGAILIVIFALRDGGWGFEIGDLWLGVAGLCAAAGYVISGKLSHILPPWEVISWALVLTLPISLLFCLIYWEPEYINADSQALTALAYVSFGSMYFGFFAWNAGLKLGGISTVGQLQLLQTFITIGISAVILDEQISSEMIGFACLIVLVVMIGRKAQVKKA